MKKRILMCAFVILGLGGMVFAQSNDQGTKEAPSQTATNSSDLFSTATPEPAGSDNAGKKDDLGFDLQLSGDHTMNYQLPAYDQDNWNYSGVIKIPKFSNIVGAKVTIGTFKMVFQNEIDIQPDPTTGQASFAFKVGENAVYWNPETFSFGIGWQYFSWGVADKQNPTDNLNARDYTVGLDAEKIPALALSATWFPVDSVSVQGVFKPVNEDSLFPTNFSGEVISGLSPYYTMFNAGLANYARLTGTTTTPVSGTVGTTDPPSMPGSFVVGGRVALTTQSIDLSISYLYDWDQYYTPDITLNQSPIGYYPSSVILEKDRVHRFGVDAKTSIEQVGLWLETAFNLPDGYQGQTYAIRNPTLDWTLGVDLSFGPNETLYANIQYLGQYVFNYDKSFDSDYANGNPAAASMNNQGYMQTYFERAMVQSLGNQTEGLLQGISINVKLPIGDIFNPNLTAVFLIPALYDNTLVTRYGSLGLEPELDITPMDSFHIKIGAQLTYAWIQPINGSVQLDTTIDRLGIYTPTNNIYLMVEYTWDYDLKK